ncbi:uncharacterized protein LOC110467182 isoform X2 [Mizuhopecten yessoensis]|uniref:uncharacterized protein LOC110467182 isoform X2 n=1 Tax=Mizuhopecten yessoensis TaxID=6573 RepID=UPI000B459A1D|nr:uncharacterized protein LOC110467182 isoform X2 [Mizuhopecten yessoensis]XP_021379829.1 uncharacterized protein LOC110467182 isoform X2 [Mizuhopecten yessoensis]
MVEKNKTKKANILSVSHFFPLYKRMDQRSVLRDGKELKDAVDRSFIGPVTSSGRQPPTEQTIAFLDRSFLDPHLEETAAFPQRDSRDRQDSANSPVLTQPSLNLNPFVQHSPGDDDISVNEDIEAEPAASTYPYGDYAVFSPGKILFRSGGNGDEMLVIFTSEGETSINRI